MNTFEDCQDCANCEGLGFLVNELLCPDCKGAGIVSPNYEYGRDC
jgi:DnaJ-class molecular chaperone